MTESPKNRNISIIIEKILSIDTTIDVNVPENMFTELQIYLNENRSVGMTIACIDTNTDTSYNIKNNFSSIKVINLVSIQNVSTNILFKILSAMIGKKIYFLHLERMVLDDKTENILGEFINENMFMTKLNLCE